MFPKWLQLQTSDLMFALLTYGPIHERKTRSQASKTRSRSYILNLRIAVNNAEMAKATSVLFSV